MLAFLNIKTDLRLIRVQFFFEMSKTMFGLQY